jgi:hypothetical protein
LYTLLSLSKREEKETEKSTLERRMKVRSKVLIVPRDFLSLSLLLLSKTHSLLILLGKPPRD